MVGSVGVKQVGHGAGQSPASQGAGPPLPASSQAAAMAGGAFLSLRPLRLLCPSERKKAGRERAARFRVCSWGRPWAWGVGGSGACLTAMGWAGTPPSFAKSPSIPQRLALQNRGPVPLSSACSSLLGNTNKRSLLTRMPVGRWFCQSLHPAALT